MRTFTDPVRGEEWRVLVEFDAASWATQSKHGARRGRCGANTTANSYMIVA